MMLWVAGSIGPARADCSKKHVYLSLASDAAHHMRVYDAEGQGEMSTAAMKEGTHWYDMAASEPCARQRLADDKLEIALQYTFDADTRRGVQAVHEEALVRARQHAANAAAAWARQHPSKWALAHPGQTPNPYADHPNQPARVVKAAPPQMPDVAQQQGITGDVQVLVTLDETGRVINATIQSSPSRVLNEPALAAARNSTFRPEIKNGRPISATYLFVVTFDTYTSQ